MDTTAKLIYSDYERKGYKDISMAYPVIGIAHKNLLYDWFRKRGRLGTRKK